MSYSYAPGILIAMPSLSESPFSRSVVLLGSHSSEGAFGVVINQELPVSLASVCQEAGTAWHGRQDARAGKGGPVDPQRGWVLHDNSEEFAGSQILVPGLALSATRDALEAYGQAPHGRYRLVLGYAGWSPGQLDREIATGAWLNGPVTSDLIFDTPPTEIWSRALAMVGVNPLHLVEGTGTLN